MTKMHTVKCSPEVRERAVRIVMKPGAEHTSQRAAMVSIAARVPVFGAAAAQPGRRGRARSQSACGPFDPKGASG
ncbi:MAG: hypothetical protein RIR33_513 [Pseudomonadota bacterium]|jgi:hypothetical protein